MAEGKKVLEIIKELQDRDDLTQKEQEKEMKDKLLGMNKKEFLASMEGTANAVRGLDTANTKVIVGAMNTLGIDVTEKQEDRARDQTKLLVEAAFLADRNALAKQKEDAKGIDKLALGFKEGWMNASQKIVTGFFDVQDYIDKQTDFDSLKSAFSQDFSVLTMAFQEIGNMPGMKTIVASLKYLAGWAAKLVWPTMLGMWTGFKKWVFKRAEERIAGRAWKKWQGSRVPLCSRWI